MQIFKERTKKRRSTRRYVHIPVYLLPSTKIQDNTTPRQTFKHILKDIASLYPGYGRQGLRPVAYTSNQKFEVSDE